MGVGVAAAAAALKALEKHRGRVLGQGEIAELLHITPQQVVNWMKRDHILPEPDYRLKATSVWECSTIENWLKA
jgi:hypothetical protein